MRFRPHVRFNHLPPAHSSFTAGKWHSRAGQRTCMTPEISGHTYMHPLLTRAVISYSPSRMILCLVCKHRHRMFWVLLFLNPFQFKVNREHHHSELKQNIYLYYCFCVTSDIRLPAHYRSHTISR